VERIKKSHKFRFGTVGAASTTIDFGILFGLHTLGLSSIASNFASTSTAFILSFTANRHYTFQANSGNVKKQIALFLIVTLFGIWAIQPVIIYGVEAGIASFNYPEWLDLAIAKLIATGATLFWNYFFYSRVVFPENDRKSPLSGL